MSPQTKAAKEHFKNQNFSLQLYPTGETKNITHLEQFRNFIDRELIQWEGKTKGNLNYIHQNYVQINNYLNEYENSEDENKLSNLFANITSHCNQSDRFISSETSEAQLLLRLYGISPEMSEAAYHLLFRNSLFNITSNVNNLTGSFAAIELKLSKALNHNESDEILKIEEFRAQYSTSINGIVKDYYEKKSDWENTVKKLQDELNSTITLGIAKDSENQASFEKKMEEYENKIVDLEKTYGEKLRLSKPVEYWDELQTDYERKGKNWIWWSIGTAALFVLLLVILFFNFPNWLKGTFHADQLKGLIIFTLIVSTFTYILHLFIKLANSAYHLSRDAEERKQLTHVYLALLKEKAIEESERTIILQALFSRADTGLLKNDGAPTMPFNTSMIDVVAKMKK